MADVYYKWQPNEKIVRATERSVMGLLRKGLNKETGVADVRPIITLLNSASKVLAMVLAKMSALVMNDLTGDAQAQVIPKLDYP